MTGVLLINLGTPKRPDTASVREYLAEFLMDPLVIDIPTVARWALIHGIILRTRPAKSAEAYAKIWTQEGSPLLLHTHALTEKVRARLGTQVKTAMAMRYGTPSIREGLQELTQAGVTRIIALPLYPQFSLAATESSIQKVNEEIGHLNWKGTVTWIRDFYEDPRFIHASVVVAQRELSKLRTDFTIFSFHGLPERQVKKTDPSGTHCLANSNCCDRITEVNRNCYRAQCFATARALTRELKLEPSQTAVSFQSRLGRTPWIQPFSDHLYEQLPKKGVKRVAVLCPSFVADCLETLEEVQIRGREQFRAAGGEELTLIPCVNSDDSWADGVAAMVREKL